MMQKIDKPGQVRMCTPHHVFTSDGSLTAHSIVFVINSFLISIQSENLWAFVHLPEVLFPNDDLSRAVQNNVHMIPKLAIRHSDTHSFECLSTISTDRSKISFRDKGSPKIPTKVKSPPECLPENICLNGDISGLTDTVNFRHLPLVT